MRKGLIERCLMAAVLLLGLTVTEIAAQDERQDPVGDVPVESDIPVEADGDDMVMDDMNMDMNMTDAPEMEEGDDMMGNVSFPTASPTIPTMPPTTQDGCYDNLDAVYFLISDDDMLFQQKRFVICPGTVVDIGFLVPGVGIDKGQAPIIPRSNTEFLCGEDGKVENNCILRGGDFAVIGIPVFFRQDLSVNNVLISGFTFEGQVQYSAFLAVPGDIVFENCIFRDQANFGIFVVNFDTSLQILDRRLEEEESEDPFDRAANFIQLYRDNEITRRLQAEEDDDKALLPPSSRGSENDDGRELQGEILDLAIRSSVFDDLQQIERKLGVEFGIISVKTKDHKLTIEDCTFANCQYGNQELAPIGYAVLVQGAEVELHDLCFVDNDFRGSGVVLLEQTANPFAEGANFLTGNYATETDTDVDCAFAAYFATDEDRRNSNFTCVPVQVDDCGGEPVDEGEGGGEIPKEDDVPTSAPGASAAGALASSMPHIALLSAIGFLSMLFFP